MCTVSMIGDHFNDRWRNPPPFIPPTTVPEWPNSIQWGQVSRHEFEALKREVESMKALLVRALEYDKANNEPHCELEEKIALLRKVAELVGVSLDDVFPPKK